MRLLVNKDGQHNNAPKVWLISALGADCSGSKLKTCHIFPPRWFMSVWGVIIILIFFFLINLICLWLWRGDMFSVLIYFRDLYDPTRNKGRLHHVFISIKCKVFQQVLAPLWFLLFPLRVQELLFSFHFFFFYHSYCWPVDTSQVY